MQKSKGLDHDIESQLESIGGELLSGSGFEQELPEAGFTTERGEED